MVSGCRSFCSSHHVDFHALPKVVQLPAGRAIKKAPQHSKWHLFHYQEDPEA